MAIFDQHKDYYAYALYLCPSSTLKVVHYFNEKLKNAKISSYLAKGAKILRAWLLVTNIKILILTFFFEILVISWDSRYWDGIFLNSEILGD